MAPLLGDPAALHDDDAIEVGEIGVPRVAQPEEVSVPSGRSVGKGANDCAPLQPINESPQQRRGDRHPRVRDHEGRQVVAERRAGAHPGGIAEHRREHKWCRH